MNHFAHPQGLCGESAPLERNESLALLATGRVGRLAFTRRALPDIVPVNFVLRGEDLLIRLDPSSFVAQAVRGAVVAFEVDDLDPAGRGGWSVTVVGSAEVDESSDEQGQSAPDGWETGNRALLLRIGTEFISGRRLGPPMPTSLPDRLGA